MKTSKHRRIAQLSDIHIRFGSRHEEYATVFERVLEDLWRIKPRRIVLTGDLFHIKVTMSPLALELAGEFIKSLAQIAPVDIILGNHDLNLSVLAQGDAITPIIKLLDAGHIITKEHIGKPLPFVEGRNNVYFFKESGFYEVDEEIVYGVYSCIDNEVLTLTEKQPGKKYIALYHAPIYGCRGDNGYEMRSDSLIRISTFNNFDMVMMGDIHEFQTFERTKDGGLIASNTPEEDRVESMSYAGSLIQQGFGEGMDKSYNLWNMDTNTPERKYIPNDYGYCKLIIAKGEIVEDRLEDLKFSLDKRKTRVFIQLQDDEENYSVEKMSQIEKWVKAKHGCFSVSVDFKAVTREKQYENTEEEDIDVHSADTFETLLREFLATNGYDNIDDVLDLSKEVDLALNIDRLAVKPSKWEIEKIEFSNLFSNCVDTTVIDFNALSGLTGIFGQNYSGKSNLLRTIVWLLYQEMLDGGDVDKVVNMYTGVLKGWGRIYLKRDGLRFYIYRSATIKPSKKPDEKPKVSYSVEYKYAKTVLGEDGTNKEVWVDAESEEAALEKKEVKKTIIETIGTFHDFTKVALQTQSGKENYLNLTQQPKNDLVGKFLGLEIFRDRFDYANKAFNKIKALQKHLGDPAQLEVDIETSKSQIATQKTELDELSVEKQSNQDRMKDLNTDIVTTAKNLVKVEIPKETNPEVLQQTITQGKNTVDAWRIEVNTCQQWLAENFKKEVPVDNPAEYDKAKLEATIANEQATFNSELATWKSVDAWLKENTKKPEIDTKPIEVEIDEMKAKIVDLKNKCKIAQGENCPTCNHETHPANPELEAKLRGSIERGTKLLTEKQQTVETNTANVRHNILVEKNESKSESLKLTLKKRKMDIDSLKEKLTLSDKISEILAFNLVVDGYVKKDKELQESIANVLQNIETCQAQLTLLETNKKHIEANAEINRRIKLFEDDIKAYQIANNQLDARIRETSGNIRVLENNVVTLTDRIGQIREAERTYRKYSIYLQAVDRDGIQAIIIRKKLPIINHRINSVLKDIVRFKVEMYITKDGDIKDSFYFNENKSDRLPMVAGSGAQKFLTSIAITDALHYVSCLTKPSVRFIDEGFGTLDDEKSADIQWTLNYLKNRYKNVMVVTHKNEIKDFVDHIIQVSKTKNGIPAAFMNDNPDCGITQFNIAS